MSDPLLSDVVAASDASPPPALYELETKVMDRLWSLGEATVRDVLAAINAGAEKELAYTTVMTVLQRLDTKGLAVRRREGRTDVYSPRLTRDAYQDARAEAEVTALVDEFGDRALVQLARRMAELDPKRRERLRRLARGA